MRLHTLITAIVCPLLSACIGDIRPSAGSGCGVEAAHPSLGIDNPLTGCLIASYGQRRLPFCPSEYA